MIAPRLLGPEILGQPSPQPSGVGDRLGPVGTCPTRPSLLIAISDDSGSVTAPGGSDPIAGRYAEMDRAFTAVAQACRCRRERAAVLHFDTPAGDSGPHPLTRRGLHRLRTGLRVPAGAAGSSHLLPALTAATELARAYRGSDIVLMVCSDFHLTDPDPRAVSEALGSFPGLVYACLLGRETDVDIPGADQRIALGGDRRTGDVARALLAGLTVHRRS